MLQVHPDKKWKELIIRQLAHYKKKARYFDETNDVVNEILFSNDFRSIAAINLNIILKICEYLDINKEIIVSSEKNFNYEDVNDAGEWALRIAEQMGAAEYINPAAGAKLFSRRKIYIQVTLSFHFWNLKKLFIHNEVAYVPALSIIDVLMFNGIETAKKFLKSYFSAQIG